MDTTTITRRLDQLEADLPGLPSSALEFTRSGVRRVNHTVGTIGEQLGDRLQDTGRTISSAARTVAGQTRSSAARLATTARSRFDEAGGQLRAQSGIVADRVGSEAADGLDDAARAIDPLEDMTKDELYELAQERDLEGRSSMSKRELIAALD